MIRKLKSFISDVDFEMKKVSWLTKKQLINSTVIVLVFALIISIFLFILDFGLSEVVKIIYTIKIN